MSVVACRVKLDTIEVASDSQTTHGYSLTKGKELRHSKLWRVNDMTVGVVGYAEDGALMQLFAKTHRPKEATEDAVLEFVAEFHTWVQSRTNNNGKLDYAAIIAFSGKAFYIEDYFVTEIASFWAIGSGDDYAKAALHLGHEVEKAVEVACELNLYCELPIIHYSIPR
jgi:ATP-dependent protease HslVU (ClpYQ) peptidase subunit